jgi:SAM-dependent methyltransferase
MSVTVTAKDLVRHFLTRSKLTGVLAFIHKANGEKVDHLYHGSLAERFASIYETGVWLNGRATGSPSGLGSEMHATEAIRKGLPELLRAIQTGDLLDLGCGDFNWMKEVEYPCRYIGADIVPDLIKLNNALHSTEARTFTVLDATVDPLPRVDTVLCREVLFHLSFRDISRLVENVRRSGASFLIATTDKSIKLNADIPSGDFRNLNLTRTPFSFPEPAYAIPDDSVAQHRSLAAWKISTLPYVQG